MSVTANKKLIFTFRSSFQLYNSSFKNLKKLRRFPQNSGYQNQYGYQNRAGQYQKQCSRNHKKKDPN